jgi:hypothetical protein
MFPAQELPSFVSHLFARLEVRKKHPSFKKRDFQDFWKCLELTQQDIAEGYSDKMARWGVYHSETLANYLEDFAKVFSFKELLDLLTSKELESETAEGFVFVDALGPGMWVRDLILDKRIRVKKGIAITLSDERSDWQKKEDEQTPFQLFPGNVFSPENVEQILQVLEKNHIDLLMCRPYAGVNNLPLSRHEPLSYLIFFQFISVLYELTNPDGVLLFQVPAGFKRVLEQWGKKLTLENSQMFKISLDPINTHYVVFKVVKKIETLPFLSISELKNLLRS